MLPLWALIVFGAIALQFVAGGVLAAVGSVMMGGRPWAPPHEARPLSQKVAVAGAILLVLAAIEFVGLAVAFLWWAEGERFA